jgi:hypothetical protein
LLQFLSLCSQLTAAASDKDITKQLEDNITSIPAEVQATGKLIKTDGPACRSICDPEHHTTDPGWAELSSSQHYATSTLNISNQQSENCSSQQAEQYEAIANASRK